MVSLKTQNAQVFKDVLLYLGSNQSMNFEGRQFQMMIDWLGFFAVSALFQPFHGIVLMILSRVSNICWLNTFFKTFHIKRILALAFDKFKRSVIICGEQYAYKFCVDDVFRLPPVVKHIHRSQVLPRVRPWFNLI